MRSMVASPPVTPIEPVTEVLHGVEIIDPYRWLEDQNSPRTRTWIEEQTAYTRAYLDAIPGRERIRKRIKELLAVEVISEPRKVGNRYFFLKRTAYQEQPVIAMRDTSAGEDVVLVDPSARGEGASVAVSISDVSPNGQLLAYDVRNGGEELGKIELLDVRTRQTLPPQLPEVCTPSFVFDRQSTGIYYVQPRNEGGRASETVRWHRLGASNTTDVDLFKPNLNSGERIGVLGSPTGQHLIYAISTPHDPPSLSLYVHNLTSNNSLELIVDRFQGILGAFFVGGELLALTDWNAPNYRIVAIPFRLTHPGRWREVVPERASQIEQFAVAANRIFLAYVDNIASRIQCVDTQGNDLGYVPCPDNGTATLLPSSNDSDVLMYRYTSFAQPPIIFEFDPFSGHQYVWAQNHVPIDPSMIEVERASYCSKDGTRIPMFLVCHKARRTFGPVPTVLAGYGGFGTSLTPQFTAYATFLLEQGCLFAVANLRGGAEFGSEWHGAAKRHRRQTAIDDFVAAAEWLVEQGYADPRKIAVAGGSNAGLLALAALTQRPDLVSAVLCIGPLTDMLRYHHFGVPPHWRDEFGVADKAEDFAALLAYSPYHQVRSRISYPATMLVSGAADGRCHPLHSLKMAARLQSATTGARPILLDYKPHWGHVPVQPLSERIRALTDRLAFLCDQLGLKVLDHQGQELP